MSKIWVWSTLPWEKMSWARRELPDEKVDRPPSQASEILSRGDVIYTVGPHGGIAAVRTSAGGSKRAGVGWTRTTAPSSRWWAVSTSFKASSTAATQARRQPGSGFKPFIYAAAFDKGLRRPAWCWMPRSSSTRKARKRPGVPARTTSRFEGPIRLREALVHLQESGIGTIDAGHRSATMRATTSPASVSINRSCRMI